MSPAKRGSYPHPVLDSSDDVASDIEVLNTTVTSGVDDVEVRFQIRMTDPHIQSLLDEDAARYSFRWTCSSTITSRELEAKPDRIYADSTGYTGWIDQQDVRGIVRLEIRIVAARHISQYSLDGQHPDYGDATFDLLPGDILADGGYFEFEPGKLYDPLSPPVGSCFAFVPDKGVRKGLRVRFHDDAKVLVAFPEKILTGFALLKERPQLQISLVVLPALMQTISFIRDNLIAESNGEGEDLTDRQWYTAIKRLVEDVGSFDDPAFDTAQKILGQPLEAALMSTLDDPEPEQ